eukprot:14490067-Alexandrium_andersonii.AAC.1
MPDRAAVDLLQDQVIAVALGRPSGWAEFGDVFKALLTGLRRARRVYKGRYDRDYAQESWVNIRPFD